MIAPVKKFGRARLSTGLWKTNMADIREWDAFVGHSISSSAIGRYGVVRERV